MTYIISEPCIGTKDTSCADVCPVDCIHPAAGEERHEEATMLYIDPPSASTATPASRRAR